MFYVKHTDDLFKEYRVGVVCYIFAVHLAVGCLFIPVDCWYHPMNNKQYFNPI